METIIIPDNGGRHWTRKRLEQLEAPASVMAVMRECDRERMDWNND